MTLGRASWIALSQYSLGNKNLDDKIPPYGWDFLWHTLPRAWHIQNKKNLRILAIFRLATWHDLEIRSPEWWRPRESGHKSSLVTNLALKDIKQDNGEFYLVPLFMDNTEGQRQKKILFLGEKELDNVNSHNTKYQEVHQSSYTPGQVTRNLFSH